MSRRPLCALCGERLRVPGAFRPGSGALVVELKYDLPGSPTVGWHSDATRSPESCAGKDEIAGVLFRRSTTGLLMALRTIDARGEGRVAAGSAWQSAWEEQP